MFCFLGFLLAFLGFKTLVILFSDLMAGFALYCAIGLLIPPCYSLPPGAPYHSLLLIGTPHYFLLTSAPYRSLLLPPTH